MRALFSGMALAFTATLPALYGQTPEAVIKGTVSDPIRKAPIAGVKVEILEASAVRGSTRTGKDGRYELRGLAKGRPFIATYSAAGYAPDTYRRAVELSQEELVVDVPLLCNCNDVSYWTTWGAVQTDLSGNPTDVIARARILSDSWSSLADLGLSAEARGSAARAILKMNPATGRETEIAAFAAADPLILRKAADEIRSALNAQSPIPATSLNSELQADITVSEARRLVKESARSTRDFGALLDPKTNRMLETTDTDSKSTKGKDLYDRALGIQKGTAGYTIHQ